MSDDFDKWLRDDENADDSDSDLELAWLNQGDQDRPQKPGEKRSGLTGQLPWLQGGGDEPAATDQDSEDDLPDWLRGSTQGEKPRADSSRLGVTGELSWLGGDKDKDDQPRRSERTGLTGQLSWQKPSFEDQIEEAERAAVNWGDDPSNPATYGSAGFDDDDAEDTANTFVEPEIPEWMRDSAPEAETGADAAQAPAWMRGSAFEDETDADTDAEQDAYDPFGTVDEDVDETPGWLRGAHADEEEDADTFPDFDSFEVDEETEAAEQPNWFGVEAGASATGGEARFAEEDENVPDWLSGFEDSELDNAEAFAPRKSAYSRTGPLDEDQHEDSEVPSWLSEMQPQTQVEDDFAALFDDAPTGTTADPLDFLTAADDEAQPETVGEDDDFFSRLMGDEGADDDLGWLSAIPDAAPAAAQPRTDFAQPTLSDVDSFLASLNVPELAEAGTDNAPSPAVEFDSLFTDAGFASLDEDAPVRPEWLAGVNVGQVSASSLVRGQQDRPLEDLPERLQLLREEGLELGSAASGSTLGDIVSALDQGLATPPTINAAVTMPSSQVTMSAEQQRRVRLLSVLVGTIDTTTIGDAGLLRRKVRARSGVRGRARSADRLLISVIVAVAVILPFFFPILHIGNLPPSRFTAGSAEQLFFDQINALQPGDYVLFAAEYGGTTAGELDEVTSAVLRHVFARGGRPIIIGSNATGLLHADNITARIAGDVLVRNRDYYVGRYILAEGVGLRAFVEDIPSLIATDIQGQPTGLSMAALDDLTLIVVVAERADSVRLWVEQVAPATNSPLLIASSISAAPLVEPYLNTQKDEITGLLVGFADGYTYSDQLNALYGYLEPSPTPTQTPVPPTSTPEATVEAPTPAVIVTQETTPDLTPAVTSEVEAATPTAADTLPVGATAAPTDVQAASPTPNPVSPTVPPTVPPASATPLPPSDTPSPLPPSDTPAPTLTPTPARVYGTVNANTAVNVRNSPNGTPITTVQPGERVEILGESEDGGWYNVRLETGQEGWISASLIELEEEEGESSLLPGGYGYGMSLRVAQVPTAQSTMPPSGLPSLVPAATLATVQVPAVDQLSLPNTPPINPVSVTPYRRERWYAITLGTILIVFVIAGANLVHVLRRLTRR